MNYKVNEIFASVQAEGANAGRAAVFIRLSGCNLQCPWCDTPFNSRGCQLTREELESSVMKLYRPGMLIVITGGEPTLQLNEDEELLPGLEKAIETNGTMPIPSWVDYVACSPKEDIDFGTWTRLPDEVKVICEENRFRYFETLEEFGKRHPAMRLFMQPLEQSGRMNSDKALQWVLEHPNWKLSVQFHKLLNIR